MIVALDVHNTEDAISL